ncbi:hypothetical protein ACFVSQ_15590 [Streptomyces niveus]|uniref:hypothetical protein n=1 Tax=Streptomyces niveus TaxID=193462 RepID=UPI0036EF31DF
MGMLTPDEWVPALYPSGRQGAAQVDTHPILGTDGVLRIHLTSYPATALQEFGRAPDLTLHLAAYLRPGPCGRTTAWLGAGADGCTAAGSASVVSAHAAGRPAGLVLDQLMAAFPGCRVAAVFEADRCVVAVRTSLFHDGGVPHGYQFVLTPERQDTAGPLSLYASGVFGWARWWLKETSRLQDRQCLWDELPHPPEQLVLVHAWREHPLHVSEAAERAQWPSPPDRAMEWWSSMPEHRKAFVRRTMGKPDDWTPPYRDEFPDPTEER